MKTYKYIGDTDELTTKGNLYKVGVNGVFIDDTGTECCLGADFKKYFEFVKETKKQSYTEEQVISLLDKFGDHIDEWYSNGFNTETETTERWFNNNKNNIK